MEQVKTKIRFIVEGSIAFIESTAHCIEIEIDSSTRDLWAEQIQISVETINSNNDVISNGDGIIRTKLNGNKKLECKVL